MKEDTEKWVHSVQDSEWGLESARATVEIDWEPNDSVLACFDWSGIVSGCEASCHVCIGSIVSVRVYTKKDICEQCRSGTQEWQHKWLTTRIQLIPPLNRWWRRSLRRSTVTTHRLSDSDNEKSSPTTFKAKVYRIFCREKPIHKVLNGGKPIDVVLWEKKISTGVLGGETAVWTLFELLEYHLLTLVCHCLILALAILFLWSNATTFINKAPPHIPEVHIPNDLVLQFASALRIEINRGFAILCNIASGKDLKKFLSVIVGL